MVKLGDVNPSVWDIVIEEMEEKLKDSGEFYFTNFTNI
jgi:hypothetical protein